MKMKVEEDFEHTKYDAFDTLSRVSSTSGTGTQSHHRLYNSRFQPGDQICHRSSAEHGFPFDHHVVVVKVEGVDSNDRNCPYDKKVDDAEVAYHVMELSTYHKQYCNGRQSKSHGDNGRDDDGSSFLQDAQMTMAILANFIAPPKLAGMIITVNKYKGEDLANYSKPTHRIPDMRAAIRSRSTISGFEWSDPAMAIRRAHFLLYLSKDLETVARGFCVCNSEAMATWCATGVWHSQQINSFTRNVRVLLRQVAAVNFCLIWLPHRVDFACSFLYGNAGTMLTLTLLEFVILEVYLRINAALGVAGACAMGIMICMQKRWAKTTETLNVEFHAHERKRLGEEICYRVPPNARGVKDKSDSGTDSPDHAFHVDLPKCRLL